MSEALIIEFSGVDPEQYREVNEILGVDPVTGDGDWPAGLSTHVGAVSEGGFLVFEVWDSREAQEDFLHSRLGPALGKAGVPEPTRSEWLSIAGHRVAP